MAGGGMGNIQATDPNAIGTASQPNQGVPYVGAPAMRVDNQTIPNLYAMANTPTMQVDGRQLPNLYAMANANQPQPRVFQGLANDTAMGGAPVVSNAPSQSLQGMFGQLGRPAPAMQQPAPAQQASMPVANQYREMQMQARQMQQDRQASQAAAQQQRQADMLGRLGAMRGTQAQPTANNFRDGIESLLQRR